MRSPFKFLDAYVRKDKDFFFGREGEVAELYQMVTKNRLILVYGQSGTGKTSLVQCGLANRFDTTDWFPLFIKRGENINHSMRKAVAKAAELDQIENYAEAIEEIYAIHLRPVYLIIDQLEELFILGKEQERRAFIRAVKEILEAKLPCRVIFILREEYLAQLYEFEKVIPSLLDRRLRVERMSMAKLNEVIQKSCSSFNITLEDPERNTQRILDSLSSERTGIHLPYLQVYLDMLWREDYQRSYGNNPLDNAGDDLYPPLTFTTKEIADFGEIEDVLQRFLHQQEREIQMDISRYFPQAPTQAVRQVLDSFVTVEGTKRPIHFLRKGKKLIIPDEYVHRWKKISDRALHRILEALENRRLLRSEGLTYELAHDSLAAIIEQERTDEQRQIAEIKRRLENSYYEFTISGEYLTRKQLDRYDDFMPKLQARPEIQVFFDESREADRNKRIKARNRRRVIYLGLFFIAVMMTIAAIVSNKFRLQADTERQTADDLRKQTLQALKDLQAVQERETQLRIEGLLEKGRSEMALGQYQSASTQFEMVLTFDSTHQQADSLRRNARKMVGLKELYEKQMEQGRQALEADNLLVAMDRFNQAGQIPLGESFRREARTGIVETRSRILPVFRGAVDAALIFKDARSCELALEDIEKAKALMKYLSRSSIEDELKVIKEVEESCLESSDSK